MSYISYEIRDKEFVDGLLLIRNKGTMNSVQIYQIFAAVKNKKKEMKIATWVNQHRKLKTKSLWRV